MNDVERLHQTVDVRAHALAARHAARLQCRRGCHACCVDGVRVFEVEADVIRRHHAALLAEGTPHPAGACAFLDGDGACRIYPHRPYVCRTQGLPLRWFDEVDDDGTEAEFRDICPLNDTPASPLESLPAEDCWTIGPSEASLQQLQAARGDMHRVRLRDLFHAPAGDPV